MRNYHFNNYYLSNIQHGIQGEHASVELFIKYENDSEQKCQLYDWAKNHKTVIGLNGGNNQSMNAIWNLIDNVENPYPYAKFNEDDDSLSGLMTNISIVLPDDIYNKASDLRCIGSYNVDGLTAFQISLIELISTSKLI